MQVCTSYFMFNVLYIMCIDRHRDKDLQTDRPLNRKLTLWLYSLLHMATVY